MSHNTVVGEAQQVAVAISLIELGARLQLLQEETSLSRERLLRLYKEIKNESPSKGMLPYSTDWFMSWQPNIHASLFMDIYQFMVKHANLTGVHALISAYRLYLDQVCALEEHEPVLSITRAWFMIRFFKAEMLQLTSCTECNGQFVAHTGDLHANYVCGICHPPARAGKTKLARKLASERAASA
ncbi:MAG: flagellar transcriptional regulator FlhC [Gallionella sp.]